MVHDCVVYDCVVYNLWCITVVYYRVVYDFVVYDCVVYDCVVYDCVVYHCAMYKCVVYGCVVYSWLLVPFWLEQANAAWAGGSDVSFLIRRTVFRAGRYLHTEHLAIIVLPIVRARKADTPMCAN